MAPLVLNRGQTGCKLAKEKHKAARYNDATKRDYSPALNLLYRRTILAFCGVHELGT